MNFFFRSLSLLAGYRLFIFLLILSSIPSRSHYPRFLALVLVFWSLFARLLLDQLVGCCIAMVALPVRDFWLPGFFLDWRVDSRHKSASVRKFILRRTSHTHRTHGHRLYRFSFLFLISFFFVSIFLLITFCIVVVYIYVFFGIS